MKIIRLLLCLTLLSLANVSHAQRPDNYPPDRTDVVIDRTNLPIVWLEVDHAMILRDEYITARMKIIDNGAGNLNYGDTIAHPGQHIDYNGYIALRYRGNTSFSQSDKKPYSIRPLDKPLEEGGTKKKVKLLGMGKDNKWALLAPYSDKSMMRDLLAFEISRPWMDYTPQGRYCARSSPRANNGSISMTPGPLMTRSPAATCWRPTKTRALPSSPGTFPFPAPVSSFPAMCTTSMTRLTMRTW